MNYTKTPNKCEIENEARSSALVKITTFAVCLSPVLFIYRALGIFMLGEIVLILLSIANVFVSVYSKKIVSQKQIVILFFAVSILLISCLGYSTTGLNTAVLPRLIRLLFCFFIAALLGEYFFDYNFAKRSVIFISVVATVLIVFQKVYNDRTGSFIYFISKRNIYSSVYNDFYFQNLESLSVYRPMSIFLEPSHFCQYILFALVIVLFRSKFSVKDIMIGSLLSIGIFISASSTGVVICAMLWFIYIFTIIRGSIVSGAFNPKMLLIIFLFIAAGALILSQFGDRVLFAIERIYNRDSSTTEAFVSRLGTFSIFTEYNSFTEFLYGRGYGVINEGDWYASIPYYFSGTGLLGILALAIFFISLYFISNKLQRKLVILFFVLCFTTEILTNYWLIFILPLIMTATEEKGIEIT